MILFMALIIIFLVLCYGYFPTCIAILVTAFNHKGDTIYLTFDDGPNDVYTPELLDLLKTYNIKATFFLVADYAVSNKDIVSRIKEDGHIIGVHSKSHMNAMYKSRRRTNYDFKNSINQLESLDLSIKYFRPPYGCLNLFSFYNIKKYHLKPVLWSKVFFDWSRPYDKIKNKMLTKVHGGDILLLHDGRGKKGAPQNTLDALKIAIPYWIVKGYKFGTIENYYELKQAQ